MSDSWRCFVAVPLPPAVRTRLAGAVERWRAEGAAPDVRWTAPESWHVTLAFLGETDAAVVPALLETLASAIAAQAAWTAPTAALGAFPDAGRARVVWYGVADPEGRLARLAATVRTALEPLAPALRATSPFRAHVTVARARDARGTDLAGWIAGHVPPAGSLVVDRAVLVRSHLGGGRPARYEVLGSAMLRARSGAMMDAEAEASVDG